MHKIRTILWLCVLCVIVLSTIFIYNDSFIDTLYDEDAQTLAQKTVIGSANTRHIKFAQSGPASMIGRIMNKKTIKRQNKNKAEHYNEIRKSIKHHRAGNYHIVTQETEEEREQAIENFRQRARLQRGSRGHQIMTRPFRSPRNRAKMFKEDYIYCNITDTPSLSQLLIDKNEYLSQLTVDKINRLKKLRVQKPNPCSNTKRKHPPNHLYKLNIDLDDTLVPFINRCNVKVYGDQPDLFEYYGHSTTPIGYMHVFKSGGSTVMKTWDNVLKYLREPKRAMKLHWRYWEDAQKTLPREYRWVKYKKHFYDNIFNKQYIFSFVRDPISRFLSSFFEYVIRQTDRVENMYMNEINDKNNKPMHLLNELAFIMEHRMKCEYKHNNHSINPLNIYWDDHLNPQMHFLLDDKWKTYALNYVGFIEKMDKSLYHILMEFNNVNRNKFSFDKFKESFFTHERDRHNKEYQLENDEERHSWKTLKKKHVSISDLILEPNQLNDNLVILLCNLYWLDYICLPFDIPTQCNLTELYLQHYGNHVVYNSCYE